MFRKLSVGVSVYTVEEAMKCIAHPLVEHVQVPLNILSNRTT